ncbi:MAG: hypothetical protein K0R17_1004 [Rariglobus sp.]|jgi:prepilin-type N-terminal cleavage/methylation domain-containing protein|nr:hypothetical protein [Rariglobus sp.]
MFTAGNNSRRLARGFTLIELLVVIGLISILAAGIGISMREGNPTSSLRGGQNTLVGLLSSARGQAALSQADAMIIVDVTSVEEELFLRSLQVVVRSGAGWRPVGAPVMLPPGIFVVPPQGTSLVTFTGTWDAKRKSSGFDSSISGVDPADTTNNQLLGRTYLKFQNFTALGTTSGTGRILVTPGKRTSSTTIELDNPEMLRGVTVSRYGVPTLINEAGTFDNL